MHKYGKSLAAVLFAVLTAAYAALSGDRVVEPDEWVNVAVAAATAVGVYIVPLDPEYRWGKTAVAAVLSGLQVLATVILGGLDSGEWILVVLAVLTALGVGLTPAVSDNGVAATRPAPPL